MFYIADRIERLYKSNEMEHFLRCRQLQKNGGAHTAIKARVRRQEKDIIHDSPRRLLIQQRWHILSIKKIKPLCSTRTLCRRM